MPEPYPFTHTRTSYSRALVLIATTLILNACAIEAPAPTLPSGFASDGRKQISTPIVPTRAATFIRDTSSGFRFSSNQDRSNDIDFSMTATADVDFLISPSLAASIRVRSLNISGKALDRNEEAFRTLRDSSISMFVAWDSNCTNPRISNVTIQGPAEAQVLKADVEEKLQGALADALVCFPNGVVVGSQFTSPTSEVFKGNLPPDMLSEIRGNTTFRVAAIGTFSGRRAFVVSMNGDAAISDRGTEIGRGLVSGYFIFDLTTAVVLKAESSLIIEVIEKQNKGEFKIHQSSTVHNFHEL